MLHLDTILGPVVNKKPREPITKSGIIIFYGNRLYGVRVHSYAVIPGGVRMVMKHKNYFFLAQPNIYLESELRGVEACASLDPGCP